MAVASDGSDLANVHVVYVHGICRHTAGFSRDWWSALKQYLPGLPDANHHEVVWSDVLERSEPLPEIVRARRRATEALALARPGPVSGKAALSAQIKDVLADRASRQFLVATLPTTVQGPLGTGVVQPNRELLGPQMLFNIPGIECIDDFVDYLLDNSIRTEVIGRFNDVILPLVNRPTASIHIMSHSWGTVIAYEALRGLDNPSALTGGSVRTLFTIGSALAIPPVKRMLLPIALDGARPRLVRTWVNLNAHFDIVGGNLQNNPFQVDDEYLELPATGCSALIPNPICAHSSYFESANQNVNRDIFARYVQE